jgi:hypothetical protein
VFTKLRQSAPSHPVYLTLVSVLSSHLCICLSSGLFTSAFSIKFLYTFVVSSIRATWPAYIIILSLITLVIIFE